MSEISPEQFRWIEPIEVRWADMDSFGHVNNARYFTYCESARMSWFGAIELDRFKEAPEHGPALVSATCNFRQQVHHPASLDVGVRATRIGGKSFTLDYGIFLRHTGTLVADGTSVVVWVDYSVGAAIPLPDALRERIREFDGL